MLVITERVKSGWRYFSLVLIGWCLFDSLEFVMANNCITPVWRFINYNDRNVSVNFQESASAFWRETIKLSFKSKQITYPLLDCRQRYHDVLWFHLCSIVHQHLCHNYPINDALHSRHDRTRMVESNRGLRRFLREKSINFFFVCLTWLTQESVAVFVAEIVELSSLLLDPIWLIAWVFLVPHIFKFRFNYS